MRACLWSGSMQPSRVTSTIDDAITDSNFGWVAAPRPRPVYGPPGYMMIAIPRPVYGPPMFSPGAPISLSHMAAMNAMGLGQLPIPRPVYGVPGRPIGHTLGAAPAAGPIPSFYQQPRFQSPSNLPPPPLPHFPPPRQLLQPARPPPPPPQLPPSLPTFSSHSISSSLDSYGPPASGPPGQPFPGASFGGSPAGPGPGPLAETFASNQAVSGGSSPPFSTGTSHGEEGAPHDEGSYSSGPDNGLADNSSPGDNYGPPPPPPPGPAGPQQHAQHAQDFNDLGYTEPEGSYEAPGTQPDSYYKRNSNQGRDSGSSHLNPREYLLPKHTLHQDINV